MCVIMESNGGKTKMKKISMFVERSTIFQIEHANWNEAKRKRRRRRGSLFMGKSTQVYFE